MTNRAEGSGTRLARRGMLAGFGAAAVVSLAGCDSAPGKGLIFATQKNHLPLVAQKRGEFEKRLAARGIAPVQWVEFSSGPLLMQALAAGAVDFGLVGDAPVVYALAAGSAFKFVAAQRFPGLVASGILVSGASAVTTVAGLKGRRVAYTRGSTSEYVLIAALRRSDLAFDDITPVDLTPGNAQSAFVNGSIDAWAVWDPFFTSAQIRGGARKLALPASELDTISYYVASDRFVKDRPQVLRATLDELRAEAVWANAHRTYYRDRIAEVMRLPPDVLDAMLAQYGGYLFGVEPITPAIIANEQKVAEYLRLGGGIGKSVDVASAAWEGWR